METAKKFEYPENFIKYLGTSGGRFSMIRQLRYGSSEAQAASGSATAACRAS